MAKAKGIVTFQEDLCKGCGLCITVCPVKILAQDTTRLNKRGYHPADVVEPEKCIACISCAHLSRFSNNSREGID